MDEKLKNNLIKLLQDLKNDMTKLSSEDRRNRINIINRILNKNSIKPQLFVPKNPTYFAELFDVINFIIKKKL